MTFLKQLGQKIKVILGVLAGLFGFILFYIIGVKVSEKIKAKDKMEYELARIESEKKITELQQNSEEKIIKLEELKAEEQVIREKIKVLQEYESQGQELSLEELDRFFDSRGF